MFDTIDAALYYPSNDHIYFFKGPRYMKWKPGQGMVPINGRVVRDIGIDGWKSFPSSFRQGVDAALPYPNGFTYFFRGSEYIKYKPGEGVQKLNGDKVRRIGIDGWKSLPSGFRSDIDAAIYYRPRQHAYFFKGDEYVKYRPGEGVVELNGSKTRRLGIDGWNDFPSAFKQGIEAAIESHANDRAYFFRGRDYIRWKPGEGVDPRYPRRIGLLHGGNAVDQRTGGWAGLSRVLAGPLVGRVTADGASIWIWLRDGAAAASLQLLVNGAETSFASVDPVDDGIRCAVEKAACGSQIRVLELGGLKASTDYDVQIHAAGSELDRVAFTTPPAPGAVGRVKFVFGSCSNMSKHADVPVFTAMRGRQPDFALLCGDNCYYVHANDATGRTGGPRPRDWESRTRMLLRHVQARNHPQFTALGRQAPILATWDDHDFGYNNAKGTDRHDYWVGRDNAARVFRAMWPNGYVDKADLSIYHRSRWGPVEVFVTDDRYYKHNGNETIWGQDQLDWLIDALEDSDAPVKVIVVATQFLYNGGSQEGHARQAPGERSTLLAALGVTGGSSKNVSGRVLFLSGDVHYSELMRWAGTGPAELLEFTSSPMRWSVSGSAKPEKAADSRLWAAKKNAFGLVSVDVTGYDGDTVTGTIRLEARDSGGNVITGDGGEQCRTTWDLATGALS